MSWSLHLAGLISPVVSVDILILFTYTVRIGSGYYFVLPSAAALRDLLCDKPRASNKTRTSLLVIKPRSENAP